MLSRFSLIPQLRYAPEKETLLPTEVAEWVP